MTIAEIKARYDGEWVFVGDPVTDESLNVQSGTVLCHSKDRDEMYRLAAAFRPKRAAVLFNGPVIPRGTAAIL